MTRNIGTAQIGSGPGLLIRRIAAVPVALIGAILLLAGGVLIAVFIGESTNDRRVEPCHPIGPSISMIGLAIIGGALVLLAATLVRRGVDRRMVAISMGVLAAGLIVFFAGDNANAGCPLFD